MVILGEVMKFESLLQQLGGGLSEEEIKLINKAYTLMSREVLKLNSKVCELESRLTSIHSALTKMKENNERIKELDSPAL